MSNRLTIRQERFVDVFGDCRSATEAARRAGYSEWTAKQTAYELMQKPKILAAIQLKANDGMPDPKLVGQALVQLLNSPKPMDKLRGIRLYYRLHGI